MQLQDHKRKDIRKYRVINFVVQISLAAILGLLFVGAALGVNIQGAHAESVAPSNPPVGYNNPFPYPACTWWADQRFHQLHNIYVPWRTQSDAWEWTARAYQFGWRVSNSATVGSIINLQPWVQGAYGLGHVAVVEQVYKDGSVLASNMSWGPDPYKVVYVHFYPGSGVTFISY